MVRRKRKLFSTMFTRLTAVVMLLAICAMVLPVPLPSLPSDSKDLSEPFPCQASPCGCQSAKQCWTTCCCNSPAQRLSWAKKNGVVPPSYAVLSDDTAVANSFVSVKKSCCSGKHAPNGDVAPRQAEANVVAKRSCCAKSSEQKVTELANKSPSETNSKEKKLRAKSFAIGALMMRCAGKSADFSLMPWSLVPPPNVDLIIPATLVGAVCVQSPVLFSVSSEPDVPPPRPVKFS